MKLHQLFENKVSQLAHDTQYEIHNVIEDAEDDGDLDEMKLGWYAQIGNSSSVYEDNKTLKLGATFARSDDAIGHMIDDEDSPVAKKLKERGNKPEKILGDVAKLAEFIYGGLHDFWLNDRVEVEPVGIEIGSHSVKGTTGLKEMVSKALDGSEKEVDVKFVFKKIT